MATRIWAERREATGPQPGRKSGRQTQDVERADDASAFSECAGALAHGRRLGRTMVRHVDRVLQRIHGVREFTDDSACLLRIAETRADKTLVLPDDVRIACGEPVIELHLWNEHVPILPRSGPTLPWSKCLHRRMDESLRNLARHLAHEAANQRVKAICARPAFTRRGHSQAILRLACRYGFMVIEPKPRPWWTSIGTNLFLWALTWAFNPLALRRKGIVRLHLELWISAEAFFARYGRRPCREASRSHRDRMLPQTIEVGARAGSFPVQAQLS